MEFRSAHLVNFAIVFRNVAWHLILKMQIVSTHPVSSMKFHPQLFCMMIYQLLFWARWLTRLPLSLSGDFESNPRPSQVCAMSGHDWCKCICTKLKHNSNDTVPIRPHNRRHQCDTRYRVLLIINPNQTLAHTHAYYQIDNIEQ